MPQVSLSIRCWRTVAMAIGAVSSVVGCWLDVSAHDFLKFENRQWAESRISYMPIDRSPSLAAQRTGAPGLPIAVESVLVLPNRWAVGQNIRICFSEGDAILRKRILDSAATFFKHTNLKPIVGAAGGRTCVPQDQSEIRIGFNEPGYWSYVGNDSLSPQLIKNNLTSMNFQGFDINLLPEPKFSGIVLHEFGHALGFHHEHQSPAGGCDAEYDWDKLYLFYLNNYGWDKAKVDTNVRQLLADRRAYDWSQIDPKSIMLYKSDPQFLFKGTNSPCYFDEVNNLSPLDIQGAQRAYPGQNVVLNLQAQANAINSALQSGVKGDLKDALSKQLDLTKKQLQVTKTPPAVKSGS